MALAYPVSFCDGLHQADVQDVAVLTRAAIVAAAQRGESLVNDALLLAVPDESSPAPHTTELQPHKALTLTHSIVLSS